MLPPPPPPRPCRCARWMHQHLLPTRPRGRLTHRNKRRAWVSSFDHLRRRGEQRGALPASSACPLRRSKRTCASLPGYVRLVPLPDIASVLMLDEGFDHKTVAKCRERPDWLRGLASHSAGAPADGSAGLADGGSGHAPATDHCPTYAAAEANLRDHAVRLRDRRGRHCLRRSGDGQGKASNCNQSDHSSPPLFALGLFNPAAGGPNSGDA